MKSFESLTHRGQLSRLRRMAREMLLQYKLNVVRMQSLVHLENTTFRIDTDSERYVLRINRPEKQTEDEILSEAMWLDAIRRDTDLVVPQPVLNRKGDLLTTVEVEGVPEKRHCVLFKWVKGQFYRKRLSPTALERIGHFTARLHCHALDYDPPATFKRRNVLWGDEKEPGVMGQLVEAGLAAGRNVIDVDDLEIFVRARHHLHQEMTTDALSASHLIHADLHHGNCLFHDGYVRAIDFDDCGWGHFLYDLAVTQWYLQARPDFPELCRAQLRGYRQVRPLSVQEEALLPTYRAARSMLMAMYLATRSDNPNLRRLAPQYFKRCADSLRDYLAQQRSAIA